MIMTMTMTIIIIINNNNNNNNNNRKCSYFKQRSSRRAQMYNNDKGY